ncbi:hypothetical protein LIER_19234 [Lithospermum erythrorhizon]|uniref:FLZ-type domain-containing protein n=1 Tax=Lithospermum erythrorhizon TaxID=34254 RepID=A0AAV3QI54_LITER
MVGLRVVLEGISNNGTYRNNNYHYSNTSSRACQQVVSKASMMIITKTSPISPIPQYQNPFSRRSHTFSNSTSSNFLDNCFLCRKKLLPCHDIYMYKGDMAFCSEECRSREIYMDEKEAAMKANTKRGDSCSFSAIKTHHNQHVSSSTSSPSSSRSSRKFGVSTLE